MVPRSCLPECWEAARTHKMQTCAFCFVETLLKVCSKELWNEGQKRDRNVSSAANNQYWHPSLEVTTGDG